MPLKNVHYQKLETEESDVEEDELPPSHVKLQSTNHVKGKETQHVSNDCCALVITSETQRNTSLVVCTK